MKIACPNCSASYSIDPRLVPEGGATVQCSTCRHVFTALGEPGAAQPPPPPATPQRSSTQMMGAVGAEPQVSSKTLSFGSGSGAGVSEWGEAPPPPSMSRANTQVFGREAFSASLGTAATPAAPAWAADNVVASLGAASGKPASQTQTFGAVGAAPSAPRRSMEMELPVAARTSTQTFGAAEIQRAVARPVQLPSDGKVPPTRSNFPIDLSSEVGNAAADLDYERGLRRGRLLQWLALAALVLGAAGFGGWKWYSGRTSAISAEMLAEQDTAVTLLRKDDAPSLEAAAAQFADLSARSPSMVEAKAFHVIALAFQLDDTRIDVQRLEKLQQSLRNQITRLQRQKSPSDWANRVNALEDEVTTLEAQRVPFGESFLKLDDTLNTAFGALNQERAKTPEDEAAILRAQAVYYGVKGADQALALGEQYRALGKNDGWPDLVYAEYVINAKASPPASLEKARAALEPVRTADSAFIRPHVLVGRLALATGDLETATSALEVVLGFNPAHVVAERLRREIREREDAARAPTPVPAPYRPAEPSAPEPSSPEGDAALKDAINRAAMQGQPDAPASAVEAEPAPVEAAPTEEAAQPTELVPMVEEAAPAVE